MEDSPPESPNGLLEEDKKSPSSSAKKGESRKDRKHRQDKNDCVDALERFFQIETALALPKRKLWGEVTELVWSEAWELEKQRKASMKLGEYAEAARQIVKSARDAMEEAQFRLNLFQSSMERLQQQLLDEDYAQLASNISAMGGLNQVDNSFMGGLNQVDNSFMGGQGLVGEIEASLQLQDYDPNFVKGKGDVAVELENKLAILMHEFNAEVQKHSGHPVNLKFSKPFRQPPDPNNDRNRTHRMSKKQGHIALKVFFYMHTNIVLPKVWKKAEELVKETIKDAEEQKKLNGISGRPEGAATLEQLINITRAAFEEAKRECNDMVPGDLQNQPESVGAAQMLAPLESWEATGSSSGANYLVAAERHGEYECWLMEMSELFPEIKDGGFMDVLLQMAKRAPQGLKLEDSNQEMEAMDLWVSKLKQKFDNTYQELGALRKNKRKSIQPKKLPTWKKGKRPA